MTGRCTGWGTGRTGEWDRWGDRRVRIRLLRKGRELSAVA